MSPRIGPQHALSTPLKNKKKTYLASNSNPNPKTKIKTKQKQKSIKIKLNKNTQKIKNHPIRKVFTTFQVFAICYFIKQTLWR